MKAIKYLTVLAVMLLVVFVMQSFGQPYDPPGGGDPPVGVPIDGGVGFLIAAGIGLGAKKYHDYKKKKKEKKTIE